MRILLDDAIVVKSDNWAGKEGKGPSYRVTVSYARPGGRDMVQLWSKKVNLCAIPGGVPLGNVEVEVNTFQDEHGKGSLWVDSWRVAAALPEVA